MWHYWKVQQVEPLSAKTDPNANPVYTQSVLNIYAVNQNSACSIHTNYILCLFAENRGIQSPMEPPT